MVLWTVLIWLLQDIGLIFLIWIVFFLSYFDEAVWLLVRRFIFDMVWARHRMEATFTWKEAFKLILEGLKNVCSRLLFIVILWRNDLERWVFLLRILVHEGQNIFFFFSHLSYTGTIFLCRLLNGLEPVLNRLRITLSVLKTHIQLF